MKPERLVQLSFIKSLLISGLLVGAPVIGLERWLKRQPSRWAQADRSVAGSARLLLSSRSTKIWHLKVPDKRFGGVSALAIDRGRLLAVTDSGVAIRFAALPPRGREWIVELHDLPAGPGVVYRKSGNDAESLLADRHGRGWWVGYEQKHSLLLFDRDLKTLIEKVTLKAAWPANVGAEALIINGRGRIAILPEGGTGAIPSGTSDAVRLPDGRLALLVRWFSWRGFVSEIRIGSGGGRPARAIRLDLGPLDNPEAIAAAPLANGGTRLWIATDDNFRPWMRTLLVALDLPPGA